MEVFEYNSTRTSFFLAGAPMIQLQSRSDSHRRDVQEPSTLLSNQPGIKQNSLESISLSTKSHTFTQKQNTCHPIRHKIRYRLPNPNADNLTSLVHTLISKETLEQSPNTRSSVLILFTAGARLSKPTFRAHHFRKKKTTSNDNN